uniref:Uncharacterized protein n=1 Tax=Lepeophtheirus salmonis TaxID=72036 RepID=A0A0K2TSH5_LEPSM
MELFLVYLSITILIHRAYHFLNFFVDNLPWHVSEYKLELFSRDAARFLICVTEIMR